MSRRSPIVSRPGHGGSWIVTYSDMVTLMMGFFICVIAFAWKNEERFGAAAKSVPDGSVIWRPRLHTPPESVPRSEIAPIYLNPSAETSARIVQTLEAMAPSKLADNFAVRLPLSLLFKDGKRLSPSGARLLHALADHLRELPYDLQFQVNRAEELSQAIELCHYLACREGYEPARLAVGGRPPQEADDCVWLVLFQQM